MSTLRAVDNTEPSFPAYGGSLRHVQFLLDLRCIIHLPSGGADDGLNQRVGYMSYAVQVLALFHSLWQNCTHVFRHMTC